MHAKVQYAQNDTSELLEKDDIWLVQSILGTLLYYAHGLDYTMLPALNKLASQQSAPTQDTMKACHHSHPDARL